MTRLFRLEGAEYGAKQLLPKSSSKVVEIGNVNCIGTLLSLLK